MKSSYCLCEYNQYLASCLQDITSLKKYCLFNVVLALYNFTVVNQPFSS